MAFIWSCWLLYFYFGSTLLCAEPFATSINYQCIPYKEYAFFCTRLVQMQRMVDANGNALRVYMGLNHTDYQGNHYSIIYKNQHITSKPGAQLTCFAYSFKETIGRSLQYVFYNNTNDIWQPLNSITINNIGLIMPMNEPAETIYAGIEHSDTFIQSTIESYNANGTNSVHLIRKQMASKLTLICSAVFGDTFICNN